MGQPTGSTFDPNRQEAKKKTKNLSGPMKTDQIGHDLGPKCAGPLYIPIARKQILGFTKDLGEGCLVGQFAAHKHELFVWLAAR
jgi:hypothetical protein